VPLNARHAYRDTALTTAPPGRILTMLYDRLLRDLHDAIDGIEVRDLARANEMLKHAQDIISALHEALDVSIWPAGEGLGQLYDFLATHIMTANLKKSVPMVKECVQLIEPLAEAWHEAYAGATSFASR
jgi:flagellar protein FliS